MKKIIILLLFTSAFVNAQDCKFQYNEVDAFTKVNKFKTEKQVVAVTISTSISFSFIKNNVMLLSMDYHASGIKSIVIGRQEKMSLLLLNDEVVDLYPIELVTADVYVSDKSFLNTTNINCKYLINSEQIDKIRNVGLNKIRLNTSKYYYDFDVNKNKWVEKLNISIDCFNRALNE